MINETKQLNQKMDHRHTHIHSPWHRRKVDEYRENGISCKRLCNYKKVTKENASNHWMDSDGRPIDHLVWYFNESESGFNKDILVASEIIIEGKGLNTFSEIKKRPLMALPVFLIWVNPVKTLRQEEMNNVQTENTTLLHLYRFFRL